MDWASIPKIHVLGTPSLNGRGFRDSWQKWEIYEFRKRFGLSPYLRARLGIIHLHSIITLNHYIPFCYTYFFYTQYTNPAYKNIDSKIFFFKLTNFSEINVDLVNGCIRINKSNITFNIKAILNLTLLLNHPIHDTFITSYNKSHWQHVDMYHELRIWNMFVILIFYAFHILTQHVITFD